MATDNNEANSRWKFVVFNRNITEEESIKFYDSWADHYDDDQIQLGFKRQYQLAEKLATFYPDREIRKDLKILDIAAGTGLVGVGLIQEGFKNIHAVDGNYAMLQKLNEKKIYKKSFCAMLGNKNSQIHQDIQDGSYDVVLIMGGFAQSHLPIDSLYQAARALKPGGLFINLMTKMYLDIVDKLHGLEPLMAKMETEGIWRKVDIFSDGEEKQGVYHIYRKI